MVWLPFWDWGSLAGAKIDPGILSSEPCPFLSGFLLLLPLIIVKPTLAESNLRFTSP